MQNQATPEEMTEEDWKKFFEEYDTPINEIDCSIPEKEPMSKEAFQYGR